MRIDMPVRRSFLVRRSDNWDWSEGGKKMILIKWNVKLQTWNVKTEMEIKKENGPTTLIRHGGLPTETKCRIAPSFAKATEDKS